MCGEICEMKYTIGLYVLFFVWAITFTCLWTIYLMLYIILHRKYLIFRMQLERVEFCKWNNPFVLEKSKRAHVDLVVKAACGCILLLLNAVVNKRRTSSHLNCAYSCCLKFFNVIVRLKYNALAQTFVLTRLLCRF